MWDTPTYRRNYLLKKTYNLTPDEYDDMVSSQGGRCAICRTDDPQSARTKPWNVDHDHDTDKVRGLLCGPCNFGLGAFKDNVDVMAEAIRYVERYRKAHLSSVKDA